MCVYIHIYICVCVKIYIYDTQTHTYEPGPNKKRRAVGFAVTVPSAPFCTSTTDGIGYVYNPGSCAKIATTQ